MMTRIAGIPCQIEVTSYSGGTPEYRRGHPDNWEPEDPPEITWEVQDRNGRPAPWLARKMTDKDISRIEAELLEAA